MNTRRTWLRLVGFFGPAAVTVVFAGRATSLPMNPPLTPALSPSDGERVSEGRVRGIRARSWSQSAIPESWRLSMDRSLSSAGFQPAVSPTFSRPGHRLRERVQVAGYVGYARRLRVENPSALRRAATPVLRSSPATEDGEDGRYSRLESLRYGVHRPKARPIAWRRSSPWIVDAKRCSSHRRPPPRRNWRDCRGRRSSRSVWNACVFSAAFRARQRTSRLQG